MCARKWSVTLAVRAIDDYDKIMIDTLVEWGAEQAADYKRVLDDAIAMVAIFPAMGLRNARLPDDFRSKIAGSHVICYQVRKSEVRIHRILHQRQDPTGQFDELE